jgi:hypothetical protein
MWAIQRGSPSCGKAARWEIWGIDPIATTGRERIFLSLTLLLSEIEVGRKLDAIIHPA